MTDRGVDCPDLRSPALQIQPVSANDGEAQRYFDHAVILFKTINFLRGDASAGGTVPGILANASGVGTTSLGQPAVCDRTRNAELPSGSPCTRPHRLDPLRELVELGRRRSSTRPDAQLQRSRFDGSRRSGLPHASVMRALPLWPAHPRGNDGPPCGLAGWRRRFHAYSQSLGSARARPSRTQMTSSWFKLFLYATTGRGPPTVLCARGARMRRLPEAFSVHSSSCSTKVPRCADCADAFTLRVR